ncbi:MAG: terminase large subunit domain-containing protein [Candidatus Nealsonbacteria bacterium]
MKIISDSLLQKKIGFTPHKFQQQILDAYDLGKREIVVSAGVRSGKSMISAYLLLRELLSNNKSLCVISPSYELTERVLEYIKKWLPKVLSSSPSFKMRPFPKIVLNWGGGKSFLEGKSAENPTGILGQEYDLVVVDEASRIPRAVYEEYIFSRLVSKKGKVVLISTPLKKDWFYELWINAKSDSASFQFRTQDNPHNPNVLEEVERARKKLPRIIFERDFMAVFSDEITSIFRNVRDCISGGLPRKKMFNHSHIGGLDLAKEEDFTAFVIGDKISNEIVFVDRWQKIPYPAQRQRILKIAKDYSPCRIIIDSRNIGSMMSDELRREGVSVQDFTAVGTISKDWKKRGSKEKLVEKTMNFFEAKEISIPNHTALLDELSSYSYRLSDFGNIRYGSPVGLKDDLVDALMLCCWGLRAKKMSPERVKRIWQQRDKLAEAKAISRQRWKQYT